MARTMMALLAAADAVVPGLLRIVHGMVPNLLIALSGVVAGLAAYAARLAQKLLN